MDSIYLVGSEQVQRAGANISAAADEMTRAVTNFVYAVEHLARLVDRMEVVAQQLSEAQIPKVPS